MSVISALRIRRLSSGAELSRSRPFTSSLATTGVLAPASSRSSALPVSRRLVAVELGQQLLAEPAGRDPAIPDLIADGYVGSIDESDAGPADDLRSLRRPVDLVGLRRDPREQPLPFLIPV